MQFDILNENGAIRFVGTENMTNTGVTINAGQIGYIEKEARAHAQSGKAKAKDFSCFAKEYTDDATGEVKTIYVVFLAERGHKPLASIR